MPISKKLKWKRSLSNLRFLNEELDYVDEASQAGALEFESFYRRFCAENNINIRQLDAVNKEKLDELYGRNQIADKPADEQSAPHSPGDTSIVIHNTKTSDTDEQAEYQATADDIAMHDAFSKLFKKIALKLHPDRVDKSLPEDEQKLRINMFQKVNQAFEDKKYYLLLDVADKYNISTPRNYDQQIRWMEKESYQLVDNIESLRKRYNFIFAEAETIEEKESIIKKFLHQLFGIIV